MEKCTIVTTIKKDLSLEFTKKIKIKSIVQFKKTVNASNTDYLFPTSNLFQF